MRRIAVVFVVLAGLGTACQEGANDRVVSEAWAVYRACQAKAAETEAILDEAIEIMSATVTREMEGFQRTMRTMVRSRVPMPIVNSVAESLAEIGESRILLLEAQAADMKLGRFPELHALSLLEQEIVAVTDTMHGVTCPRPRPGLP